MKDIAEKDGDLTKRIEITSKDEVGELVAWFNMFVDKIEGVLVKMIEGTKKMANASAQIAEGNQNLSSRTERQAASLEETASLMEEMAAAIKQNTGNVINANKMVQESKEVTLNGVSIVNISTAQMEEINASSKKIANIMNEISAASVQQQNRVEQVNKAVIDMDGITQQNAALVEEIASSSEELSSQAGELVSLASYFNVRNIV